MLPNANRLKSSASFDKVKEKGKLYQCEDFAVSVLTRDDKGPSRYGIVTSSKISKIAVHRNRIRRAIREAIRINLVRTPSGFDFVFLVKKTITKKTTDEIMHQVNVFLHSKEYVK